MKQSVLALLSLECRRSRLFVRERRSCQSRKVVVINGTFRPGTIVVRTNERRLYYVTGVGQAMRYPVGVGRIGKQWSGIGYITGK